MNRFALKHVENGRVVAIVVHNTHWEAKLMYLASGGTQNGYEIWCETLQFDIDIDEPQIEMMYYSNGRVMEFDQKEFINPTEFDKQRFKKVQINGNVHTAAGRIQCGDGVTGYVISETDAGFNIHIDVSDPNNSNKCYFTRNSDMFIVEGVPAYQLTYL